MTVLGTNVLIDADKEKESIIITKEVKEVLNTAKVVAFGPEVTFELEIGCRVIWNNRQGMFVELDNKEYILVDIRDILIIL